MPLICPTIHPLVMMTVSDGNLKNLQIGSTTHTTDPNHEPPSSAENVLSLSLFHTPHNRHIFVPPETKQQKWIWLNESLSLSLSSLFPTLREKRCRSRATDAFFRSPFNLRRRQFSGPSVTQKSFAAAAAPRSPDGARLNNSMTSFTWHARARSDDLLLGLPLCKNGHVPGSSKREIMNPKLKYSKYGRVSRGKLVVTT